MDMHTAALLSMQNGGKGVAVGLQAGERQLFPIVQNSADFLVGRSLLLCPADHAAGVGAREIQAIRHGGHRMWIAPEYLHIGPVLTLMVVLSKQVRHRTAAPAALYRLAVAGEFMVHRHPHFLVPTATPVAP